MRIFNTDYEIRWHNVGSQFLEGLAWTAGAATAISITALIWRTLT